MLSIADKIKKLGFNVDEFKKDLFDLNDKIVNKCTLTLNYSGENLRKEIYPDLKKMKEKYGLDIPLSLCGVDMPRLDTKLDNELIYHKSEPTFHKQKSLTPGIATQSKLIGGYGDKELQALKKQKEQLKRHEVTPADIGLEEFSRERAIKILEEEIAEHPACDKNPCNLDIKGNRKELDKYQKFKEKVSTPEGLREHQKKLQKGDSWSR